jgi:hypothetical protein
MLFHASIPADNPEHVARVIAELWRGEAMPFPPHPGAWMAWSGDDRGTELEIFPRGQEEFPSQGEVSIRTNPSPSPYSEVHFAMGTRLEFEEVLVIAGREGWMAQRCDRGGLFNIVEFWVENKFLLELMPDAEQKRYVENMKPDKFRELFGMVA